MSEEVGRGNPVVEDNDDDLRNVVTLSVIMDGLGEQASALVPGRPARSRSQRRHRDDAEAVLGGDP